MQDVFELSAHSSMFVIISIGTMTCFGCFGNTILASLLVGVENTAIRSSCMRESDEITGNQTDGLKTMLCLGSRGNVTRGAPPIGLITLVATLALIRFNFTMHFGIAAACSASDFGLVVEFFDFLGGFAFGSNFSGT